MPCSEEHYIDHDPCLNCLSTHTVPVEGTATENECITCGVTFNLASAEYKAFASGEDEE